MANIILTEYCNLKCPYCFASTMIEESSQSTNNITIEQFDKILNWLMPTAITRDFSIGLIGGEPTLHPQFSEILQHINYFNSLTKSNSIIFSNGLCLEKYLYQIGKTTSILINVNKLNNNLNNKLLNTLDKLNILGWFKIRKATLGCNLYLQENDYSFFWNIVDRYQDISIVRVSVTAPTKELKNDKEKYYSSMKNIFLNFLYEANKRNIEISYDCNQIPLCFFDEEEIELINKLGERKTFCSPVIDINPKFKATCCFGVYSTPIDCSQFQDIDELTQYFQTLMTLKRVNNNNSLCQNCEKLILSKCQGGCLSFSSLDKN